MMKKKFETLPGIVEHVLNTYRNAHLFNYKRLGQWNHLSTEEFAKHIRRVSLGLRAIGLKPGDKCGIILPPSPQWLIIDLAIMVNGAVSVPMFPNISYDNFKFEVSDSNMKFLFIRDKKDLELDVQGKLKDFKKVIALDVEHQDKNFMNFLELATKGDKVSTDLPELYYELVAKLKEEDLATIIYTSGSTGQPKGVPITHKNIVSQVLGAEQRFPLDSAKDKALSCLPLAHVFERMVIYYYMSTGMSVYFADDIKNVGDLLRELHPTIITLVPRLLEKVYAKMSGGTKEFSGFKKFLAENAFKYANKAKIGKKGFLFKVYDTLVYKKLRAALGGNLRMAICGSAKLNPDIERFFLNIGLPVYQGYGLTECSPVVAANYPGYNKTGTVGPMFPGVTVKIASDNEILVKGLGVFSGYYNNTKETKKVIDKDGWFHTGDLGSIKGGYVTISGRKKELFKTSNGKYVSPVPIEQLLSQHKLIDMAVVIAEGRKFVSALLVPDFENLKVIQEEMGCSGVSGADFLKSSTVTDSLRKFLNDVNKKLNHWEGVRKYRIINEPLTTENGELTPTMKIRRHIVEAKCQKMINSMYSE